MDLHLMENSRLICQSDCMTLLTIPNNVILSDMHVYDDSACWFKDPSHDLGSCTLCALLLIASKCPKLVSVHQSHPDSSHSIQLHIQIELWSISWELLRKAVGIGKTEHAICKVDKLNFIHHVALQKTGMVIRNCPKIQLPICQSREILCGKMWFEFCNTH